MYVIDRTGAVSFVKNKKEAAEKAAQDRQQGK